VVVDAENSCLEEDDRAEASSIDEEMLLVSKTLKFIMNVQLGLILFFCVF
jgi:hypothetical protein